ncbi:hypothetical protein [Mycobacterium sp. SMC-4]|uniref:hypothetical protein n=1 Tax=Mycobacterium sp. SMC-4 TaxID=2857059 RepID=UPI003D067E1C
MSSGDVLSTRMLEWDDIDDVADRATTRRAPRTVVLRLHDGREEIISVADVYLPGGALADNRAVQRLRDGRFDLD